MSEPPKESARDPARSAVSPTIVKRGAKSGDDDDADAAAPAPVAKQKMLPTGLSRAIVIATIIGSVIVGAASLLKDRYSVLAVPSSPNGGIYRLDRMTGALKYCGTTACSPIVIEPEAK